MPSANRKLVVGARLLATLIPFVLASAAHGDPVRTAAASGGAVDPALEAALWRLVGGHAEVAPFDPASFVGPPAPLGILFAPAATPFAAGMRIQLEAPLHPAGPPAPAPRPEPIVYLSDVYSRLVPVRHPDGSLTVDLTGIVVVDARADRDAAGLHVGDSDDSKPAGGVDR